MDPIQAIALAHLSGLGPEGERPRSPVRRPRSARGRRRFASGLRHLADRVEGRGLQPARC